MSNLCGMLLFIYYVFLTYAHNKTLVSSISQGVILDHKYIYIYIRIFTASVMQRLFSALRCVTPGHAHTPLLMSVGRGFRVTLTCCFTGLGETFPAKLNWRLTHWNFSLGKTAHAFCWLFTETSGFSQTCLWQEQASRGSHQRPGNGASARGLRSKGKNGTNDAYAIMQVAKDKFSTSVAEKSVAPVVERGGAFDLPLCHPK